MRFLPVPNVLRLILAGSLLIGGCSVVSDDGSGTTDREGYLSTSQTEYDAELRTDGRERVVVNVPYETRNPTTDTLYLVGCRNLSPPVLEKFRNGEWDTVYGPVVQSCLTPPSRIAPGEVRRDTFRLVGYRPGQNIEPTFDVEIDGTYRLRRMIYTELGGEQDRTGEAPVPPEKRVSNPFELK
jgi:hypothetical protein